MRLQLFGGRANPPLAEAVASGLGIDLGECSVEIFPDDEYLVEVREDTRGRDVYLIQSSSPPVADHLLELLLMADACRRGGAARVTGIVPYFGYARQDRRVVEGEPVGARLLADLLCVRLDRVVGLDLHNAAIEGFFSIPFEHVSAVNELAKALRILTGEKRVVVAPDLGAAKLAQRYAELIDVPVAYVHKERISGSEVAARRLVGEVTGRSPILVDDMISTGGTMVSAMETVLEAGCRPDIVLAATHGLFVGNALDRLAPFPIREIFVTDSVLRPEKRPLPVHTVSVGPLLAETVRRLHES